MSGTQLPPDGERAGAEGSQRALRRGRAATIGRPRPLEFDRNGFPVPQESQQRSPEFRARIYRLLSP